MHLNRPTMSELSSLDLISLMDLLVVETENYRLIDSTEGGHQNLKDQRDHIREIQLAIKLRHSFPTGAPGAGPDDSDYVR
jgi:hypothetical protein